MKNGEVFTPAFVEAELVKFGPAEMDNCENSPRIPRDLKAVPDPAFEEGALQGKLKAGPEAAKALKTSGVAPGIIAQATGLTEQQIDAL